MLTGCGIDISVANRGHGDDNPVEGSGDGGEAGVVVDLNEVAKTADDQTGDPH